MTTRTYRTYYHALLDRTFRVRVVKTTKARVVFDILDAPAGVQVRRSVTLKQAERLLGYDR